MSAQPGLLKKVQGIGWYLDEANMAQVSTNILDYELTPLHVVYEEVRRGAEVRQTDVFTLKEKQLDQTLSIQCHI